MMNFILRNMLLIFFLGLTISFNSCKNDDEEITNTDKDTSSAIDNNLAEKTYDDVSTIGDQGYYKAISKFKVTDDGGDVLGNCASVTLDTISNPMSLTIDFGDENCLCGDNRNRRGKIIISFTGPYRQAGTVLTHSFEEYYVENNKVLGTKTVTNLGYNAQNHLTYQIVVAGQIIKANSGGTLTWNSTRIREWIEGESTQTWLDDVYLITGNASGISAAGTSFTMDVLTALRKEIGCRYFVSGIYILRPEGKYDRTVDFGSGDCDNLAIVTINRVSYTVILP